MTPQPNPTQPYGQTSPVSSRRHRDFSVKILDDFGHFKEINSLPLIAAEFRIAALEYPIVFAETDGAIVPVAVFGVRRNENLFVDDAGRWTGRYLPAFLRRYPFVFATDEQRSSFTLCVDEAYPGLNADGRGERLFDSEGVQTNFLNAVVEFLKLYHVQYQRTQAVAARLAALGLLEPVRARVRSNDGETLTLGGFLAVNRERLKALAERELLELASGDGLELIHLHLLSLHHLQVLANRTGDVEVDGVSTDKETEALLSNAAPTSDGAA